MTTDQVTITITAAKSSGLAVVSESASLRANAKQVDLFGAESGPTGASRSAPPADPAPGPTIAAKTPPEAATQASEAPKPWEDLSDEPKGLNFKPPADLNAKMNWVCANVPGGMSRLQILRAGAMAECDRLIALHYKG